jgi:L-alanine-DL-glutamate epimerase-like enolase superfamily enzyme
MKVKELAARILDARVSFRQQPFRVPLILSSGPISEITSAEAAVTVRVHGREGTGRGVIYLSDLWAWPDPVLSHVRREGRMRELCERTASDLPTLCGGEPEHPLELGLRLHEAVSSLEWPDTPPLLARAVCLSPFDAALHDAVGQALQRSAFTFYEEAVALPSADAYFPAGGAARAISRALQPPRAALTAWMVVGASEPRDEIQRWIQERGYHAFKLKLGGKNNLADADLTVAVYRMARSLGVESPRLCVDSNCANPDAASVCDYLLRLQAADPAAYEALEYVEQPTGRDIAIHAYDWHPVTALKPVLLDEGLTDFDQMKRAAKQGWSGFALKTCKGHSFTLVAAAWAKERGLLLAQQDLTNPGLAAIHSYLMAAHLPACNGLELNSPQYTPDANDSWLPRLKALFEPTDGYHRLPGDTPVGLGTTL